MSPIPTTPDYTAIEKRFLEAGVVPPSDRAAGAYACTQRLLESLHWLRQPRSAAAEPAHTFSLVERD